MTQENIKILAKNRKAYFQYEILKKIEAGIALKGTEVKSVRNSRVNLGEGYISIDGGEAFLKQVHISPYEQGNIFNTDPVRIRKLLLHKKEIAMLAGETSQKGYTLIPLTMYLKYGKVKVSVGVARGKNVRDKRDTIAKREVKRKIDREIKKYNSGIEK